MKISDFILIVFFISLASCSIHMQIPGKPGKHPKGKVVITVPTEKPEVNPIPDGIFPYIH